MEGVEKAIAFYCPCQDRVPQLNMINNEELPIARSSALHPSQNGYCDLIFCFSGSIQYFICEYFLLQYLRGKCDKLGGN